MHFRFVYFKNTKISAILTNIQSKFAIFYEIISN